MDPQPLQVNDLCADLLPVKYTELSAKEPLSLHISWLKLSPEYLVETVLVQSEKRMLFIIILQTVSKDSGQSKHPAGGLSHFP